METAIKELSPDKVWILANGGNWMKILQEGETISYPDDWWDVSKRGQVVGKAGDICKIHFQDSKDSSSPITYQYIIKRVAYLNENHKVVKTEVFDEYLQDCLKSPNKEPCCCGYSAINLSNKEIIDQYSCENSNQYVIYSQQPESIK